MLFQKRVVRTKLDIYVFIKETKVHDINFCAYDDFQELPSPGVVIKDWKTK